MCGLRRSTKMKHIISTLIFIFFVSCACAESLFNMPDGWTKSPDRKLEGTGISALEQYKSAAEDIQVSIMQHPSTSSEQSKVDTMAGLISGMKNRGYKHGSTTSSKFRGHDLRHLQGEFKLDGYEGVYLADTYVIFTDIATTTLSISIDDGSGGRELGSDILNRLKLDAVVPDKNVNEDPTQTRSWQIGEKIGYSGFFAIVGLGVFSLIKRLKSSNKK